MSEIGTCLPRLKEEEHFTLCQRLRTIIVTPAPVLARLKGLDNRMIGCVEMFGGVLVLRGILLDLRVPIAREEMRLPEHKKSPFLDFSGARNEYYNACLMCCFERKAHDKLLLRSSLFTVFVTLLITLAGYDWVKGSEVFRSSPLERLHVVQPQQSLNDVLPLMAGRDVNQLPVVQNGAVVGVVSRDAIVQYLEVRRSLGLGAAKSDVMSA